MPEVIFGQGEVEWSDGTFRFQPPEGCRVETFSNGSIEFVFPTKEPITSLLSKLLVLPSETFMSRYRLARDFIGQLNAQESTLRFIAGGLVHQPSEGELRLHLSSDEATVSQSTDLVVLKDRVLMPTIKELTPWGLIQDEQLVREVLANFYLLRFEPLRQLKSFIREYRGDPRTPSRLVTSANILVNRFLAEYPKPNLGKAEIVAAAS